MKRLVIIGVLASSLLFPFACSTFNHNLLVYDQLSPITRQYVPTDDGDYIFAVAVSGGGSRAAIFSAAVMKELYRQIKLPDGRSITDEIDYISSVSGGSLSMAYYCMNKPDVDSSHTDLYDKFYVQYLTDMRKDIGSGVLKKFFHWYRVFATTEKKGLLLKEAFDKLYFYGLTFDEISQRQKNGWCPTLILNGTNMDTGSKFLFTTLTPNDFDDAPEALVESLSKTGFAKSDYHFGGDLLGITFCNDIGLSIGDMEVSRGVVASGSVPFLLGPIVLKDQKQSNPDDEFFTHIADGGISDNQGITTVMQLIIDRFVDLPERHYKGGLVIIIDSNQAIDPSLSVNSVRGFNALGTVERAMNISVFRGKALTYITIMFLMSADPRFKNITFVYISPYQSNDPEIITLFQETPTRFKIDPDKADNLERAAEIVVGKVKDELLNSYLPSIDRKKK
ncbi:MAG: patatin-like phospholipase family protein [Deltaproteobacteria bacterium]|nr:patatin-like phospholipase family protein [Candidatus Zymogenaceae bacterium]